MDVPVYVYSGRINNSETESICVADLEILGRVGTGTGDDQDSKVNQKLSRI